MDKTKDQLFAELHKKYDGQFWPSKIPRCKKNNQEIMYRLLKIKDLFDNHDGTQRTILMDMRTK